MAVRITRDSERYLGLRRSTRGGVKPLAFGMMYIEVQAVLEKERDR